MAETQWYYGRGGAQAGPVAEEELRRMAQSGELAPTALVWRSGMEQWQPAWQATNFFAAQGAAPGAAPASAPLSSPPPLPPPGAPTMAYAQPYGYGPPPQHRDIGADPKMRMLMPVGRTGWSIAAGYLGLFSVLLVPAPLALAISLIAIADLRKDPSKHGMGRAVFGLVMGLLGTLALVAMIISAAAA